MRKLLILLLLLCAPAMAQANSGLGVGDKTPAYHPKHITGPDGGTDTCPVCKYGMRPAVQVFLNGASDEDVRSLVRTLSAGVKNSGKSDFKAFVVFIDGDAEKIKKLNKEEKADNVAMIVLSPKDDGYSAYKINPKAKSTVLVYADRVVTAKFVDYNAKKNQAELVKAIEKTYKK